MNNAISLDPTLGFAIGLGFAFLILLSLEIYNTKRVRELTPAYEYAQKRAEDEANRIVEEARKQARNLMGAAEAASMALSQTRTQEGETAERLYEAALRDLMQKLEAQLAQSVKLTEESQAKMSAALSAQLEAQGKEARTHLSESGTKIEQEYRSRLETELAAAISAAKEEAAGYARARKAATDAEITAIVGEAMRIVLQKGLPKDGHADLVRSALIEAKASGIF